MAAVLSFDGGARPSIGELKHAFDVLVEQIRELPARSAVPMIQGFRGRLSAVEADLLGALIASSGETKTAARIVGRGGKVTARSKKKTINRAKLNAKNPTIGKKMADGDLTDEQADLIADADSKTDGAAGADDDFIDAIAAAGPDQAKGVAADYVSDNTKSGDARSEHERQRSQRSAARFRTDNRLDAIMLSGDKASIALAWSEATKLADSYYRQDGGRDRPLGSHPRTHEQRVFDAFMHLLGIDSPGSGDRTGDQPAADRTVDSDDRARADAAPSGDGAVAGDGAAGQGAATHGDRPAPSRSRRYTPKKTTARPSAVVAVTLAKLLGRAPDESAELIGTGPIADNVLTDLLVGADFVGLIHGPAGEPLWLGHHVQLAWGGEDIVGAFRSEPNRSRPSVRAVRPTVVVTTTLAGLLGISASDAAELCGNGPIADHVLSEHLPEIGITRLIFGTGGQRLRLGRSNRHASPAQQLALIVRDKRCVNCGAHHTHCHAHHVMPWNAPAKGRTDIDELAFVCPSCHTYIHDNDLTIEKDPGSGLWAFRPALPHERPPPRPRNGQTPQRE